MVTTRQFPIIGRKKAKDGYRSRLEEDFLREYDKLAMQALMYGKPQGANELDMVGHREDGSPIYGEILLDTPMEDPYMS